MPNPVLLTRRALVPAEVDAAISRMQNPPLDPMATATSHAPSLEPDRARTMREVTDPLVDQVRTESPLGPGDFAYILAALKDPKRADKAAQFLQSQNVSSNEREAFATYLLANVKPRVDSNILTFGKSNIGIAPEDVLMGGMAAKKVIGAVAQAPLGGRIAAGVGASISEAAPFAKFELARTGLTAIGIPERIATPLAFVLSGYKRGAKGAATEGAAARPVKAPPTLDEQLGVSSSSTGALMDSLPNTPKPAPGRQSMPLVFDAQRAADANAAATEAADAMGVSRNPPLQADAPTGVPSGSARERIPVPVRLNAPDVLPARPAAKNFDDIARSMGLDPEVMRQNAAETAALPAAAPATPAAPADVVAAYADKAGLPAPVAHEPLTADPEKGMAVADAYDALKHNPSDPAVASSYDALRKEVGAQFTHLKDSGLKVEPWTGEGQPYKNSAEMTADIKNNQHLYYFPTEAGFGSVPVEGHPLLDKSPSGSGLSSNDELRIVHDYFAHAAPGHQFGPTGELNAAIEHLKTLSPEAQKALLTETHGQNSWVNFGPHMRDAEGALLAKGDAGFLAPADRPYAPQKAALLPDEVLKELVSSPSGDTADLSSLSRDELMKELLSRETFRNMGTGTRKRGAGYEPSKE